MCVYVYAILLLWHLCYKIYRKEKNKHMQKKLFEDETENNTSSRPGLFLVDHLEWPQALNSFWGLQVLMAERNQQSFQRNGQDTLGWHGSERSRLELTSLFWVTESDVRRTGFEPWLYVPSSVTCDKQLCLWNYSLSFTGWLWGLWEGSQGTQCPAPSSLSGNNNSHYWLCQGARSCQTFWSAS